VEFSRQFEKLVREVRRLAHDDPDGYRSHPQAKLLASVVRLVALDIPRDPAHRDYLQGKTLGRDYGGWRRAKFHERYRLFFMFRSSDRIIVYVWVNTDAGLRKAGDRNDPYAVFRRMLDRGSPPNDFDDLVHESRALEAGGG
jgi:toxin YhaV